MDNPKRWKEFIGATEPGTLTGIWKSDSDAPFVIRQSGHHLEGYVYCRFCYHLLFVSLSAYIFDPPVALITNLISIVDPIGSLLQDVTLTVVLQHSMDTCRLVGQVHGKRVRLKQLWSEFDETFPGEISTGSR